jgi:hypothetical protein
VYTRWDPHGWKKIYVRTIMTMMMELNCVILPHVKYSKAKRVSVFKFAHALKNEMKTQKVNNCKKLWRCFKTFLEEWRRKLFSSDCIASKHLISRCIVILYISARWPSSTFHKAFNFSFLYSLSRNRRRWEWNCCFHPYTCHTQSFALTCSSWIHNNHYSMIN